MKQVVTVFGKEFSERGIVVRRHRERNRLSLSIRIPVDNGPHPIEVELTETEAITLYRLLDEATNEQPGEKVQREQS